MSGFGEFVGKLYDSASDSSKQAARWMVSSIGNAATAVKAAAATIATALKEGAAAVGQAVDRARGLFSAVENTFSKTETPRQTMIARCPDSRDSGLCKSMSQTQAQVFIDKFKATDIPFDYPPDCCYARARVMCDIMEKDGFACEKLWSQGNLAAQTAQGMPVTFPDDTGQAQDVTWHYHVAPLVHIDSTDSVAEQRILDPSLSNKPLTVSEWKGLCGVRAPATTVDRITPSNAHYPFSSAFAGKDFTVDQANDSLKKHRLKRDQNRFKASGL